MKKNHYIEPDKAWLLEEFKNTPFGAMRPSEMEIVLAFFVIYHNGNDIEQSVEYLARKYRISESKAKRLKIEFAARFKNTADDKDEIAAIIAGLFDETSVPFEYSKNEGKVSFMVKDPWELKRIKQDLEDKRIVYQGDFNGKLIKLSCENFVVFIGRHYESIKKKKLLNTIINDKRKKSGEFWDALTAQNKARSFLADNASEIIGGVFSLVTGIGKKLL